uniref:interleukin-8-like n=1 Tax=Pristiophorus japonicus TaxID=55135 RepID=UPI00398F74BF
MMNCRVIAIILTVLVLSGLSTDARAIGNVKMDLRCKCISTTSSFIAPKHMKNLEIIPRGPHCPQIEIIATLRNKKKTCLNPNSPWVKKIMNRIMQWPSKPPPSAEPGIEVQIHLQIPETQAAHHDHEEVFPLPPVRCCLAR